MANHLRATLEIGPKGKRVVAIAPDWPGFMLRYRHGNTWYEVEVANPQHVSRGVESVELDGQPVPEKEIPLYDDGIAHTVRIQLGPQG